MIRLQKFLADSGIASRRQAENLIEEGRVMVNGKLAFLGQAIDPSTDKVTFDGEVVRPVKKRIYLMMNKPKETICTASDPKGRPTVYRLLPPLDVRVHSAGRLDFQTEGLLIFSNDGDFTKRLTHPSSGLERVYEVKIQGLLPEWVPNRLLKGVTLDDGRAKVARISRLRMAQTNEWVEVVLTEGRYREVRRIFAAVGCNVLKLKRVRFGTVSLGRLPIGATRLLTDEEVQSLMEGQNLAPKRPVAQKKPQPPKKAKPSNKGKPAEASAKTYKESRSGGSRPSPSGRRPQSGGPRRGTGGR
jgi:23S rRNA pseudouridine2605 synthase